MPKWRMLGDTSVQSPMWQASRRSSLTWLFMVGHIVMWGGGEGREGDYRGLRYPMHMEDAGRYQCTVTNVAGQQEKQFNLVVHGRSHNDVGGGGEGAYRGWRYPMHMEDAGRYQCTVTNVAGQQEKQFNLVVHGRSHSDVWGRGGGGGGYRDWRYPMPRLRMLGNISVQ